MSVRMQALQRQAEDALDSPAIRQVNRLAALPWLGRFMVDPVLPHSVSCPAPSTSLRFLPLVGEGLLALRFAEYCVCMERLLLRAHVVRTVMLCVDCAWGLLAITVTLIRLKHRWNKVS